MDIVNEKGKTFSRLYGLSSISHVIYMIIFLVEKSYLLAIINVAMVVCFLINASLAKKSNDYGMIFKIGTLSMVTFLISHFILLGPTFEFQYLAIGTIPLIYFASNVAGKDVKFSRNAAIASFILYCIAYVITFYIKYPLINVSDVSKNIIIWINTIMAYGVIILFMSMFVIKTEADVYALEDKNLDLEMSSNIDALTGLRNRRSIENYISRVFHLAKGEGKTFSFLMCDIDNFKHVNDTYGHDCGDQILKNIAGIIKSEIRYDDVAFRWGGEEILIVVNAKEHVAKEVAERCRKKIEQSSVVYNGQEIKVTITIGGASYYQGATRDDLVNKADGNLYIGKNNGKNQVVM